ncbi:MAG TPA: response regulator, partial [Pyrinomonadaceae bacterium]
TLSSRTVGEQVVIKVADTGVGMYPEVRSRIFDPFFTTKGTAGLGLGLAVSFGIIRRHSGNIEVESQYGKGTEFRISLPLAKIAETPLVKRELIVEAPEPTPLVAAADTLPPARLLVVDDEDFVRELLSEILECEHCEVELAQDGTEALALFREREFDGVFTDVGMPGMSGWELAREIRQVNQTIPIAIITGWGEIVGSNEQRAAGVDWVVAKPFTADRIAELVREINCRQAAAARVENVSTVAA